jgi:cell division protein FtsI/penicillin-binding protein 2
MNLTLKEVDALVRVALDNDIHKLTVRVSLDPEVQPKVQGAIDRQLARRHGKRTAFVVQQPEDEMLLLCINE